MALLKKTDWSDGVYVATLVAVIYVLIQVAVILGDITA